MNITDPILSPPCSTPCPKCGSTDINRQFFERGEDTNPLACPSDNMRSSDWVDREDRYVQLAKKDCIVHHCRTCQWEWDGDPLQVNGNDFNGTVQDLIIKARSKLEVIQESLEE